jgi:hypothetical protein
VKYEFHHPIFRLLRPILLLMAVMFSATGCDRVEGVFMTAGEKVLAAHPWPHEVAISKAHLLESVDSNHEDGKRIRTKIKHSVELRAIACQGVTLIGRFDSVNTVKARSIDKECIRNKDSEFAEWIGLTRIMYKLRMPALVARADLIQSIDLPEARAISFFNLASEANVGVVRALNGSLNIVNMSTGKAISSFPTPTTNLPQTWVSPNGRVLSLAVDYQRATFVDAETGNTLLSTTK